MSRMSFATTSATPGRMTLTATSSPVSLRMARCTCATDAEPSGCSSSTENTSVYGQPSSSLIVLTTVSKSTGSTSARSLPNSSQYSLGNTSGCVEAICPSLTNVGPSSCKMATAFLGVSPCVVTLYLRMIPKISRMRFELVLSSTDRRASLTASWNVGMRASLPNHRKTRSTVLQAL